MQDIRQFWALKWFRSLRQELDPKLDLLFGCKFSMTGWRQTGDKISEVQYFTRQWPYLRRLWWTRQRTDSENPRKSGHLWPWLITEQKIHQGVPRESSQRKLLYKLPPPLIMDSSKKQYTLLKINIETKHLAFITENALEVILNFRIFLMSVKNS